MNPLHIWRKLRGEPSLAQKIEKGLGRPVRLEFSAVGAQRIFSSPLEDGSTKVILDPLFEDIEGKDLSNLIRYLVEGDQTSKDGVIGYLVKAAQGGLHSTPEGKLQVKLTEVMEEHFPRLPPLKLILGRLGKKGIQKSIRLASYWPSKGEIRVHPYMLDEDVPAFYVTFLLYHELCHAELILSGKAKSGEHHGDDFYALEDQCPEVEKCRAWEKENLSAFLNAKALGG